MSNKINKYVLTLLIMAQLMGCSRCVSTVEERKIELKKVCPNCVLTWGSGFSSVGVSNGFWIAQDTSTKPNTVYEVVFCKGIYYPASKVDYMTKIN